VIAEMMNRKVKILCWIMTSPDNHERAKAVKETWGKRCNKLVFMSTKFDSELDTVPLNIKEGRSYLWSKTKEAFRYVYRHYLTEYDWFYKADDDT
jgi:glycoprotein-N-acetylgalactosamine 3-beta-galactosyltransferase